MYNHALDTFIRAAELGSFSKVAEEAFISPSAVIQQINHLEGELNVLLFNRSKKGVTLTAAGDYLLLESKALIQRCNDVRTHLATYTEHSGGTVLFGTNQFHMPRLIYDYWPGFAAGNESSTLSSYSFSESGADIRPNTDLIEGVFFKEPIWQGNFTFHAITRTHLAFLVSEKSPLSGRRILTEIDLRNTVVVNIVRGLSDACDQLSDLLVKNGTQVEEVTIYSTSVMIDSLEKGKAIVIPDCWTDFHPRSRIIPFIRQYDLPYGFFLSKTASTSARKFLNHVEKSKYMDPHADGLEHAAAHPDGRQK